MVQAALLLERALEVLEAADERRELAGLPRSRSRAVNPVAAALSGARTADWPVEGDALSRARLLIEALSGADGPGLRDAIDQFPVLFLAAIDRRSPDGSRPVPVGRRQSDREAFPPEASA